MKKTHAYHKPSTDGLEKITTLRESFSKLHDQIEQLCPPSRERSVALTNLETTAMWAIKAIVCNDPESVVEGLAPVPSFVENYGCPAAADAIKKPSPTASYLEVKNKFDMMGKDIGGEG